MIDLTKKNTLYLSIIFLLQGCTLYNELLLPLAEEPTLIGIAVALPEDIEALPLKAMYRSNVCPESRQDADFESYELPSFNLINIPLSSQDNIMYRANIGLNGGGVCDWQLSNITLSVQYKKPIHFDEKIVRNETFSTIFIVDDNEPQDFSGSYSKHIGDLKKELILFPLINESFLSGHKKSLSLVGEDKLITYRLINTSKVEINVISVSDKISYWIGIKEQDKGEQSTIIYPNGDREQKGKIYPNYKKLLAIRDAN